MTTVAFILTLIVALIHVYIVVLEMVLWETPRGRAAFGLTPEFAAQTKVLAGNQGLYNAFLVAGLVLGLVGPVDYRFAFAVFSLSCVIVAGLYGAATVGRKILFVQALPAAIGLALLLLA